MFGADLGVQLAWRQRRLAYVLVGHADWRVAHERRPPDEQLVEQAAGRVEVAAGVDGLAARLLGRQVLRGADHGGGLGHRRAGVGHRPGDAEVHHLDPAGRGEHHVGRLDVAVHDAGLVAVARARPGRPGSAPGHARAGSCGRRAARRAASDPRPAPSRCRGSRRRSAGRRPRRCRRPRRSSGWFSPAADCASRRNRAWNVGSMARSARSCLTATGRPSRRSTARRTSAMPPRPSSSPSS